jgi:hypothetical protein
MFDQKQGEPITRRSSASLSAEVLERIGRIEREQAALVRVLGEWDEAAAWKDDGALSAASWLAHRAAMARARAIELVRTARHARTYERTAKALEASDVSVTHVEIMAGAANKRDEVFCDDEDALLDIAPTMPPDEFQVVMRNWRNSADERLLDSGGFDAAARCYLRGTPALGNLVKIDGMFETDDWATVRAALDPLAKPDANRGVLAPRSAGRRLADALVELAARSGGEKGPGRRVRTTCDVVIDLETLLGGSPEDLLSRVCEIDGVGPISLATAERLLCDCSVGRVLMRGKSEVLDLGRRTEVPSRAQRRALARRDKHCRFPGCDRPVRWTDAHHLVHWIRGGPTDLDNLVLLCRRHHKACHEGGWDLVRNIDGSLSAERASGRAPPCRIAA